jgi:hypothetical protein
MFINTKYEVVFKILIKKNKIVNIQIFYSYNFKVK